MTGLTAPKLVWVREHEPDIWGRIRHVLLPKDYLRLRLTGDHALDKADGAGTLLFDLAARDWSAEVVDALRIDRTWLPRTHEGPDVTGVISEAAARATGLVGRHEGRGGWWRSVGQRSGRWRDCAGHCGAVGRNLGRRLRQHHGTAVRTKGPCPRVLPRRAGAVAHDVGDALGSGQPALVPRRTGAGRRLHSRWPNRRRRFRRAAMGSCSSPTSPASAVRIRIRWLVVHSWA